MKTIGEVTHYDEGEPFVFPDHYPPLPNDEKAKYGFKYDESKGQWIHSTKEEATKLLKAAGISDEHIQKHMIGVEDGSITCRNVNNNCVGNCNDNFACMGQQGFGQVVCFCRAQ